MLFTLALRAAFLTARLMPARVFVALSSALFRAAARLSPARQQVARNLAAIAAAAPTSAPVRPGDVFASYGRYWAEVLAQAARPGSALLAPLRVEGEERLTRALSRGPVCFLTGHLGNWDLLPHWWARARGRSATVVVERLEPPALFRFCLRLREGLGARVVVAEGGGLTLFRELRAGRHCALVADRVFGAGTSAGKGVRSADFLGGGRRFPSAGMDLARRAGAVLLPIFLLREAGGYVIRVHPPLPEDGDPVAAFAACLAGEIAAHPEQWCVLYPLHDAVREAPPPGGIAKGAPGS